MKRSRFSDEQVIGILQEHEAGAKCADLCRSSSVLQMIRGIICSAERDVGRHILRMEVEVFRYVSARCQTPEGVGGRER